MPLGHRANLEYEIVFLLEAYNQPYGDIMAMPSSRRHRLVKIREEIVRSRNKGDGGGGHPSGFATGLDPAPRNMPPGWRPPPPAPSAGA